MYLYYTVSGVHRSLLCGAKLFPSVEMINSLWKAGLVHRQKYVNPCQPALFTQADLGRTVHYWPIHIIFKIIDSSLNHFIILQTLTKFQYKCKHSVTWMYAPGHQTFAFATKFQWTSEGMWPWFKDGRIILRLVIIKKKCRLWIYECNCLLLIMEHEDALTLSLPNK